MDFLQSFQKIEAKPVYIHNDIKVVNINGSDAITEKDKIIILPYYVQKRGILLRYENVPAFEITQKGVSYYLTTLKCDIINNDKEFSVKEALEKMYGIKLFNVDRLIITNPIFLTTSQTTKYYFSFVLLYEGEYEEIQVTEYEKLEFKNKNAFISLDELDNCVIYDLLSKYSIDYLKKEYLLY